MNHEPDSIQGANSKARSDAAMYEYSFDLQSGRSASRVARLVGRRKVVLEIGCGPGSQSRIFREVLECDVVGIEVDPTRAEKARAYCKEVHVADLETDDLGHFLKDAKFDVVVCADVLEHLRNPKHLLLRLKDFLNPRGYLVISIPNITHAAIIYEMIHGRFAYRAEGLLDSTHVRFFSCASAISLVEDAGYWIADLQRAHSAPEHTEFKTKPIVAEDKQILATIRSRNPDADTYQFIMKAYPLDNSSSQSNNALTMREEIRQLQVKISSYESELQRLNSIVNWYRTPFFIRLLRRINPISRTTMK